MQSSNDNFTAALERYAELAVTKKAIEAEMKELGAIVKPAVLDAGGAKIAGNFMLETTEVKGRTTYDTKAAIADGVDLEPYKKVGAPYVQMKVKELTNG